MATFLVFYDPRDRLQPPQANHLPKDTKFAMLRVDAHPDGPEAEAEVAHELTELLLKNLTTSDG